MRTAWPEVALGEVAKIVMGQAPKGETYNDQGEGWPLIAGAGDFGDGVPKAKKFTTAPTRLSCPGDIVLGIRASIGEKVIADGEYCLGRGVAGIRGGERLVDRYLWFWLSASANRLAAKGRGATFLQVNRADIAEMRIPLPPVEEQSRIAAVLDAADEMRAKRRQSLALLDSLAESIFVDMFGDPDAPWPTVTVESIAVQDRQAVRTGPFGSQLLHSEFVDDGIAVLGIDNAVQDRFAWGRPRFITEEKFSHLRRYQVKPGDVLVTIMATCGRVAIVPKDIPRAINTKHLCCITLDQSRCLPEYLWAAFRFHRGLRRQLGATTRGAVMPGLNMGLIKQAFLPLPSVDAQEHFARCLTHLDRASSGQVEHARELNILFASLQHRAFRGEL